MSTDRPIAESREGVKDERAPARLTEGEELLLLWQDFNADERQVMLSLARRLHAGRRAYRPLDLAGDPRDWMKERDAELEDSLIYTTFEALKRRAHGGRG